MRTTASSRHRRPVRTRNIRKLISVLVAPSLVLVALTVPEQAHTVAKTVRVPVRKQRRSMKLADYSLPAGCSGDTTVTCSYGYTGGNQTFSWPGQVPEVEATLYGAAGGHDGDGNGGHGGNGAGLAVDLTQGSGDLTIQVGQVGGGANDNDGNAPSGQTTGGWPDGGNGGGTSHDAPTPGCGGGGSSDLLSDGAYIAVAGGGGGCGGKDGTGNHHGSGGDAGSGGTYGGNSGLGSGSGGGGGGAGTSGTHTGGGGGGGGGTAGKGAGGGGGGGGGGWSGNYSPGGGGGGGGGGGYATGGGGGGGGNSGFDNDGSIGGVSQDPYVAPGMNSDNEGSVTLTYSRSTPTVSLVADTTSQDVNGPINLTATVTGSNGVPPTGDVNFLDGNGSSVCDNHSTSASGDVLTISCTYTPTSVGSGQIQASYPGDPAYVGGQTSSWVSYTSNLDNTSTTIGSITASGTSLEVPVTVGSTDSWLTTPDGDVNVTAATQKDGGGTALTCSSNTKVGTTGLPFDVYCTGAVPGTRYYVSATYGATATTAGSQTSSPTEFDMPAIDTTVVTQATPSSGTYGESTTVTATVSAGSLDAFPSGASVRVYESSVSKTDGVPAGATSVSGCGQPTGTNGTFVVSCTVTPPGGTVYYYATYAPGRGTTTKPSFSQPAEYDTAAAKTTMTLNASLDTPAAAGQPTKLVATVAYADQALAKQQTPSGQVTFSDADGSLGSANLDANGTATFEPPAGTLLPGTYDFSAHFAGGSSAGSADAVDDDFTVPYVSATLALTVKPSTPDVAGSTIGLTAQLSTTSAVTIGSGTVEIDVVRNGNAAVAVCTNQTLTALAVSCKDSPPPGSSNVYTVVYTGDPQTGKLTTSASPQTYAAPAAPTSTTLTISQPDGSAVGSPVNLDAAVSTTVSGVTPAGSVTFTSDGQTLCTKAVNGNGHATCTANAALLPAGAHDVKASYADTAAHAATAASDDTATVTLTAATPVVTVSGQITGSGVNLAATVAAPSGVPFTPAGTVTITGDGTDSSCADLALGASTCTAALPAAGPHTYTATFTPSGADFTSATKQVVVSVGDAQAACVGAFKKIWTALDSHQSVSLDADGVGSVTFTSAKNAASCNGAGVISFAASVSLFGGTLTGSATGTLADVADTAGDQQLCLDPGSTLGLPTAWQLPAATVTTPLCIALTEGGGLDHVIDGALSLTQAGLPIISVPGVGTGTLTVGVGASAGTGNKLSVSGTLAATSGIAATVDLTVPDSGATSATLDVVGLSVFGQSISLHGTYSSASSISVSAWTPGATNCQLPGSSSTTPCDIAGPFQPANGISVHDITIALVNGALDVAGSADVGVGTSTFATTVSGTLTSLSAWSLSVTGTSSTWQPITGFSVNPSFTGTLTHDGGADGGSGGSFAYDLKATGSTTSPVASMTANGVTAALSTLEIAQPAPAGCAGVPSADAAVSMTGSISISSLSAGVSGCLDLTARTFDVSGTLAPLQINPAMSLTSGTVDVSYSGGTLALAGSAAAAITVGGASRTVTVQLAVSKSSLVIGATLDLTPWGIPISDGYVAYSSAALDSFDTGDPTLGTIALPQGLSAQGTVVFPDSVRTTLTSMGFAVPAGGGVHFLAALSRSAGATFTAQLTGPTGFPVLTLPGGSALDSATLTYSGGVLAVSATGHVGQPGHADAPATITLQIAKDGSASGSASVTGLQVFGQTVDLKGSVARSATGAVTASVSASVPGPITVDGLPGSLSDVDVTLSNDGLDAKATVSVDSVSLALSGTFNSMQRWSFAVHGDTGSWTPTAGVTLGASLNGTVSHDKTGYSLDLTATGSGGGDLVTLSLGSGATLAVTSVELSNTTPTTPGCTSATGDLWFAATGSLAVNLAPVSGSVQASGCFDITHPAFVLNASIPSINASFLSGLVTISDASLVITRSASTFSASVRVRLTVTMGSGGSFSAVAVLSAQKGGGFVVGVQADLSAYLGDLGVSGSIYYATQAESSFDTGDATIGSIPLKQGINVALGVSVPHALATGLTNLGIKLPAVSLIAYGAIDVTSRVVTLSVKLDLGLDGVNLFTANDGTSLSYLDTALQLTVSPTIVSFGLRVDMNLHLPALESGGSASDVGLSGLIDVSDETVQASLTATNWNDAFGISGLDVQSLAVQLGIDAEGLPSIGLAATVDGLPTPLANVIGYQQGAPISIAINVSADEPLLAFSIGTKDSTTPALKPLQMFGAPNMITVGFAQLYISPFGATIGSTVYSAGIDLTLQAAIEGVPLDLDIEVNPNTPSLYFKGSLGQINVGSLSFGPTTLILSVSPTNFDIEFDGQVHLGPGTVDVGPALRFTGELDADVTLKVGTSGLAAHLDFDASVQGSNYLPQQVCYWKGVLPYPCDYQWVDDAPLNISATNVGFDVNSSGLTIDIPNSASSITLPWSSNHSTESLRDRSLVARAQPQDARAAHTLTGRGAKGKRARATVVNSASSRKARAAAARRGGGQWQRVSPLPADSYFGSNATLADGSVFVAGGMAGGAPTNRAQSYDPSTGAWTVLPDMPQARVGASAVRLADGAVLVAGGSDGAHPLATADLYNPKTGTWTPTGSLAEARMLPLLEPLPQGRVLAVGGRSASGESRTAEVYDPTTGRWTATGSTITPRLLSSAVVLADGRVLVAGGVVGERPTRTAEVYDPASGRWHATGSMKYARFGATSTLLGNGQVLESGYTADAERYLPAKGIWRSAGVQSSPRLFGSATALPDHRVLAAGGVVGGGVGAGSTTSSATDLYDPATNSWATGSRLATPTSGSAVAALQGGKVLLAGGGQGHDASSSQAVTQVWREGASQAQPIAPSHPLGHVDGESVTRHGTSQAAAGGSATWPWYAGGAALAMLALMLGLVFVLRRRTGGPATGDPGRLLQ